MRSLAVLGAGMQGVAAAYDAALYGPFDQIVLADLDAEKSAAAARRINSLLKSTVCQDARIDADLRGELQYFLPHFQVAISALPYQLNRVVEEFAIESGCSLVDMGIDTDEALHIHGHEHRAREKGISVITDAGLAPGLVNVLAAELIQRYPETHTVRAYCGGLPERPVGPLGYVLRFSMDSVIGEYSEPVLALREGKVVTAEPLELAEEIEFPEMGRLEAFTTSGGSGTAPYAFQGKLLNFEYKTLRYPGHLSAMKLFRDCGFWSEEPLASVGVTPRRAFAATLETTLRRPDIDDMVLVRVEAETIESHIRLEMHEHQHPKTGFTAMERLTGFSTSIVALMIAAGQVPTGCFGCESAVEPGAFRKELERRGFDVRETVVSQ